MAKRKIRVSDLEGYYRIQIMLTGRQINILDKIEAAAPSQNRSSLIRMAINDKFMDKEKRAKDKIKHHQSKLYEWRDKLKLIRGD